MKTIFITSFHLLISRNILASPFTDLLRAKGVRMVCFVPEEKEPFFQGEFGSKGIIIIGISRRATRREMLLRYLSLAVVTTRTLEIKRKTEMGGSGEWLARVIGNRAWARGVVRLLGRLLTPRGRFSRFFEQYRPDVVFSTDVQNENDVRLMHEARERAVPVVGMVRSWDNLTAKGLIRLIPDILAVNNEIVKTEAQRFHGVPERIIRVVGIPHYDRYGKSAPHSREEFSRRLGLDQAKRFITYAPTGDRYLSENAVDQTVVAFLSRTIPLVYQLIVRLPPADSALLDVSRLPNVITYRPGKQLGRGGGTFKNNELTGEDDEILRDTLVYSDVVVAGPSTICIDAAVFNKPIILIGFDGVASPPYYKSIRRYYDYDHFQPIVASGGVQIVKSQDELAEELSRYLADPARDHAGRGRIVAEQCWRFDGQASERLAGIILGSNHIAS